MWLVMQVVQDALDHLHHVEPCCDGRQFTLHYQSTAASMVSSTLAPQTVPQLTIYQAEAWRFRTVVFQVPVWHSHRCHLLFLARKAQLPNNRSTVVAA